jgi:hypothetical protein
MISLLQHRGWSVVFDGLAGVLLGFWGNHRGTNDEEIVRCPHYWLGYEHAKYGITVEEALEQGIAPTITDEETTCACYNDGHIVATQFGEPVIGKTRHDPECNCRWIFVDATEATTTLTTDTSSQTATVMKTSMVDKNPPKTEWTCPYCPQCFTDQQIRDIHANFCWWMRDIR